MCRSKLLKFQAKLQKEQQYKSRLNLIWFTASLKALVAGAVLNAFGNEFQSLQAE